MPPVHLVTCEACGFRRVGPTSATYVVVGEGLDVVGHPPERREAERKTGTSWDELVADARVQYRYGEICRTCGDLD